MIKAKVIAGFVLTLAASCFAQEHQHGNAEKLGTVHFATSCNEGAQKEFNRAVALLHSFQFSRAIEGFNATLGVDTACGIAYWGIALSDWSNPFAPGAKEKSQLKAGLENAERGKSVGAKTERERAYLAAVGKLYSDYENTPQRARLIAYRDAMQDVAAKYPEDHEAQIFYALAIAAAEDPADKTYAGRLKAGAILEKLFEQEPEHPGLAHYIIHTYDVPALAGRALVAARRYSEIAPDAPHALHMPSHTFTRTGYWQESIDTNIAAAAAARREGQTAEELHASDYEIYAYLQTGQDEAARRIVDSLPEIASRIDPKAVISGAGSPATGYFAVAAIPARYALERRDWKHAAQLAVRETPFPHTDAMTWFARGLGAARLGQAPAANESAAALQQIQARLLKAGENYWALQVEIEEVEVRAWAALAEGKKEEALRQMKLASEREDGTEKSAVTPGPLAPARELLGEMLLEMKEPAQALEQFEATLQKEPGRFRALYGAAHAAQLSGNPDASQKYFSELLKVCGHADMPGRAEVAEAQKIISQMQKLSGPSLGAVSLVPGPCTSLASDCTEWIKPVDASSRVLVYRTYSLETKNENITRALIFVHGINRDADNHFRTALAAAFLAGALNDTIIVAPRFASNSATPGNEGGTCRDALVTDEANWICDAQRPDTWRSGGTEVGADKLSSFDFMDEILRRLARKEIFPNLKTIVVAGHSAGGQFVIRYEMLNRVHDKLGIPVSYVVANPSSYAYVDGLRPTTSAFSVMTSDAGQATSAPSPSTPADFVAFADAKNCTGYDTWPYGLKGLPGYAATLGNEQITRQLVARPVTYLLGEADVLPLGVFDTSCPAMAQGPTRLARGLAFNRYIKENLHGNHRAVVVPFCSHSQRCMLTSDVAMPLIFPR